MAQSEPLHIDAGATYSRQFKYATDDGSPWGDDVNARVVIRATDGTKMLDVSPVFNRITGDISLTLTAVETGSLTDTRYRWALELEGETETIRLLQGRVTVSPEVVF